MNTEPSALQQRLIAARAAGHALAAMSGAQRTRALTLLAAALRAAQPDVLAANALDLEDARARGLADSFLDRLTLTPARIEDMAGAIDDIAAQSDPIGRIESHQVRPNGLHVSRVRTPLGVVAIIYEARPNVTTDAAALGIRSGNAMVLRGGSDARRTNQALAAVLRAALRDADLPADTVVVLEDLSRETMAELLRQDALVDVLIPRGGEGLVRFVREHARIPVIAHYQGVCHVYIDRDADPGRARAIAVNAKTHRTSVCNAAETLLVHADIAPTVLPGLGHELLERGCTLHVCPRTMELLGRHERVVPATDEDWAAEYLSLDLAVRVVDSLDQAIDHIRTWGSDHTEAIITESLGAAEAFTRRVTSSCVMVNASTRFADGGQLGLGAEIGISTSRLHAYGPMGAEGLTTLRFVVTGQGHVR
jgi:glutamate-5-semialdehyde dehydrogenase